jgi:hypothetical protein
MTEQLVRKVPPIKGKKIILSKYMTQKFFVFEHMLQNNDKFFAYQHFCLVH